MSDAIDEASLPPHPEGNEFYGGFVTETLVDGWCYGEITAHFVDQPVSSGDGYAVAPDGKVAGIVWSDWYSLGFTKISDTDRDAYEFMGTFEMRFPKSVGTPEDLRDCFKSILPELKKVHNAYSNAKINQENKSSHSTADRA